MECFFCKKYCKNNNSLINHERLCKSNPNRQILKTWEDIKVPWNKGLIGDERCKHSDLTKLKIKNKSTGKALTFEKEEERKRKIKEKSINNGGYRKGSGRGKKGNYKGFYCDSSWELAFIIYNLEHNISIERCKEKRNYIFENKLLNYFPDFVVNNEIIEIKGYKSKQWESKILFNPDIKVLYKEDLKEILKYVIDKYGKDFIKLYNLKI